MFFLRCGARRALTRSDAKASTIESVTKHSKTNQQQQPWIFLPQAASSPLPHWHRLPWPSRQLLTMLRSQPRFKWEPLGWIWAETHGSQIQKRWVWVNHDSFLSPHGEWDYKNWRLLFQFDWRRKKFQCIWIRTELSGAIRFADQPEHYQRYPTSLYHNFSAVTHHQKIMTLCLLFF